MHYVMHYMLIFHNVNASEQLEQCWELFIDFKINYTARPAYLIIEYLNQYNYIWRHVNNDTYVANTVY